tara:strand:- start:490 stop:627 length:138 start_codon:yes stop_codon:yes gene_type:complete
MASLNDAPLAENIFPDGVKVKTLSLSFIMGIALASVRVNIVMEIM